MSGCLKFDLKLPLEASVFCKGPSINDVFFRVEGVEQKSRKIAIFDDSGRKKVKHEGGGRRGGGGSENGRFLVTSFMNSP